MGLKDDSYGELSTTVPALIKGQVFHHTMEDLYNTLDFEKLKTLKDEEVEPYIRTLFPKTTQEDLVKWFDWYIDYESRKFILMRRENLEQYFMPFKQEYYVETQIGEVLRTGHIDRIDRVGEKELMIIEYKTGKSYDPSKSYKLSDLRSELEWYRSIIAKLDEFKGFNIVGWKMINPTLGVIHQAEFKKVTEYSVDRNVESIVEILDKKKQAVKKIGPLCGWCPFAKECLSYDDPNHEIFGKLSETLK